MGKNLRVYETIHVNEVMLMMYYMILTPSNAPLF